jgi:predicted dehydrogenase
MNPIRIGIIGLGLMGKEMACAIKRYSQLLDDGPAPELTAVADPQNAAGVAWARRHFPALQVVTGDYRELIASPAVDAVYCAVPHHLHERLYVDVIEAGKHLLGEKPFGIDRPANRRILRAAAARPDLVVRCSSEFPYFPGAKRAIEWLARRRYGELIEARVGFHHASDMDLKKPLNWKRVAALNGAYGCLGDLGMHALHVPLRLGWTPLWVFADLQKIVRERPDGRGGVAPCDTFDNAVLTLRCRDGDREFSMVVETKRMAPGATNTWFIEAYGTAGSVRFSTHEPKAFDVLESSGGEAGWTRVDLGSQSFIPSVTGGIFEFGFSDAVLQMLGAFLSDLRGTTHPFGPVRPEETALQHAILTAALESHRAGARAEVAAAGSAG